MDEIINNPYCTIDDDIYLELIEKCQLKIDNYPNEYY